MRDVRHMLRRLFVVLAIGPVVVLAPASLVVASPAHQTAAQIQVAQNATLGAILVSSTGMTLYSNTAEAGGKIVCSGGCLNNWPPITVNMGAPAPTTGPGVVGNFGVILRPDGINQATFNGLPLYTFVGDKAPGDTHGNGINAFGGTWQAAVLKAVPLSATPVERLTLRISRVAGVPAGTVRASFKFGGVTRQQVCSVARCTLSVPHGESVRLVETAIKGSFSGWKVRVRGSTVKILRSHVAHVTARSGASVTALFSTM